MTIAYCSKCSKTGKFDAPEGSTIYQALACAKCGEQAMSDDDVREYFDKVREVYNTEND